MTETKVYFDEVTPEMISTFTEQDGFYTFKSWEALKVSCATDYGDYDLVELTPELYNEMLDSGMFEGHEPD
ncbi:hypothetical protein LRP52_02380 [Photobacterium sp. ZSDE20]|uniref:Uncharacterized protein n=1 Tax=Photobacterium pectinilyticum TaxID=2906793 RepID=A0ABT1MWN7_9GAMM|nr:hypothetical protein [Photobacterium sp. ZSDE20]MCQ1056917.1 hypothetical protein [Photobacterium sp. ZSDE20]MDD1821052.1 hypothetical protein [Photobacterium sp. ZSDE20]